VRPSTSLARTYTAVLLGALCVPPLVAAQNGFPELASKTAVIDVSSVRIGNFGRVSPGYYRGAQPEGRDYADLAELGVKTVVNLTSDDADPREQMSVERAGMTYLAIPMTTRVPPTGAQLAQFLSVVNDAASQPVYVHCVGGKHRTGVMTAVYRMTQDAWTADRAFKEMKQYKFGADFLHPEFKRFVYAYRPPPELVLPPQAIVAAQAGAR
jgi:tyrosine-protein phosphatase SIW14